MYQYTCLMCQNQFKAQKEKNKYCSWKCYCEHKTKNSEKICKYCNNSFTVTGTDSKKIFCNKVCYRTSIGTSRIEKSCLRCNKNFTYTSINPRNKRIFCSKVCVFSFKRDPEVVLISLKAHFERYVIRKEGCWEWSGALRHGYGAASIQKKSIGAHRLSWIINNGPVVDKLYVLHKCDNKVCTNPDHLFLGTHKDNMQDKIEKGRSNHPGQTNVKLTTEQVKDIRLRLSNGESGASIGRLFNVCRETISAIKLKRIWKYVS